MTQSSAEDSLDVSSAVRAALVDASPAAQRLVVAVLEIERRNQHLTMPRVSADIEKAIRDAVASEATS